jgi:isoleucyl-tRNA synthetase
MVWLWLWVLIFFCRFVKNRCLTCWCFPHLRTDGPPFATGLPHYGHILAGTIKDVVTRYATQTGHYVTRRFVQGVSVFLLSLCLFVNSPFVDRFGWDCHGLPVEYEIDKAMKITSPQQVLDMGIGVYNGHCRAIVSRYCKEWETIVTRMGRWIDFEDGYKVYI